ncbi:hypothetical protein FDA94_26725 [Herbidospora galbida]|uniref:Uncharacterized protein n=1 Tax=Herbidospora galbida TaxID=2575442 RepID=A0A4V5UYM1_9ACTN|nr:hypothetical protein [Herbidospora galbida]TKK85263.1 hypothetical protein FDA94_26725 [Herbidospora galbida]
MGPPSCQSAVSSPTGADELLGLTGTLHRRLVEGAPLATALRDARCDHYADPLRRITGWSFVALGTG